MNNSMVPDHCCACCGTPNEAADYSVFCETCMEMTPIQLDTEQFLKPWHRDWSIGRYVAYHFLDNLHFPFYWN